MRQGDVLVHHPYDSFSTSVGRFVEQAANDPDVLAIKLTIYRTSDDTPLVPALIRATERGKQAVCLVELKARFDERANIEWARKLEETGVHVVYGHPALKTHAKCILVVRREGDGVRHYLHVGTGNYHPKTARLYTDFGLFTTDERLGSDVADMFNFLTGYARPRRYRKALVAPDHLRDGIVEEIEQTIAAQREGKPARIRMKMNSLVDRTCIKALYRASQAGVPIELNIRGICCLVPGVAGVSENIRVVSIVGRFLEHSRIYAFERGEEQRVYIGSADLMPRNLDTRVELRRAGRGRGPARRPARHAGARVRRRHARLGARRRRHVDAPRRRPGRAGAARPAARADARATRRAPPSGTRRARPDRVVLTAQYGPGVLRFARAAVFGAVLAAAASGCGSGGSGDDGRRARRRPPARRRRPGRQRPVVAGAHRRPAARRPRRGPGVDVPRDRARAAGRQVRRAVGLAGRVPRPGRRAGARPGYTAVTLDAGARRVGRQADAAAQAGRPDLRRRLPQPGQGRRRDPGRSAAGRASSTSPGTTSARRAGSRGTRVQAR